MLFYIQQWNGKCWPFFMCCIVSKINYVNCSCPTALWPPLTPASLSSSHSAPSVAAGFESAVGSQEHLCLPVYAWNASVPLSGLPAEPSSQSSWSLSWVFCHTQKSHHWKIIYKKQQLKAFVSSLKSLGGGFSRAMPPVMPRPEHSHILHWL